MRSGAPLNLPEIEWGDHLISSLLEVGPAEPGMSGLIPVTWREVQAWMQTTGVDIPGWEAQVIRELSQEYCSHRERSRSEGEPEPALDTGETRDRAASQFRAIVRQHKGTQNG